MSSLVDTETIFGRIVTGYDVEQSVLAVLQEWSSTYLAELERQHGIPDCSIARVRGWQLSPSFDKWPEDQVPGVLVVSTGVPSQPVRHGDGTYRATWSIEVGAICSARTQQLSHELAMLTLAAHKTILVQRPSLGGFAAGTKWLSERYDQLAYDDTRSMYAASAMLAVEVPDVLVSLAGPVTPDAPPVDECAPLPLWPEVTTVATIVDHVDVIPPSEGG